MNITKFKSKIIKSKSVLLKKLPFTGKYRFNRLWPKINSIEGFLVEGQEEWMFTMASRLPQDANILEIGCYLGRSTVSFALGCVSSRKKVFSIDLFGGLYQDVLCTDALREAFKSDFFERWKQNIVAAGVSEYVKPLRGDSKIIAKTWNAPLHLLFIDGSHSYEDVASDFINFFPHVVPGGIVALHDVCVSWPGVYKAWHEIVKPKLCRIDNCDSIYYGIKPK